MVAKGDMMDISDIMDILAIDLIGVVPDDEYIVVSTNRGEPAALAPNNSKAGEAFRNIALRIKGEDVPFLDLSDTETLWNKILNFFKAK
jgi:septum site-determining protein MinD